MNFRPEFYFLMFIMTGMFPASLLEAAPVDYSSQIKPLLENKCLECHGQKKKKSGLQIDELNSLLQGGDSGKPAVVPGKSAESVLLQRITSSNEDEVMPPKGPPLTPGEVALIKDWIDQGAVWPTQSVGRKKHWAYEKPFAPSIPEVRRRDWPRSNLDFFVLEKLEQEKLEPSREADRTVLLRRVSLDLTGLPPTPAETESFLDDTSPAAYEKAVDRLLASPHYGERWARPWLDLARYADTKGYESDKSRSMWPYRDWVIKALNADMPFDQFTLEQLAGDMLPQANREQKVATGFHRNTMTNTEGGTDDEEFRHDAVVDRLNTTFTVWMGSTMACAQCHNHKYDPFSMKEYYQLFAFFNNTADADRDDESPTLQLPSPEQQAAQESYKGRISDLDKKVKAPSAELAVADTIARLRAEQILKSWKLLVPEKLTSSQGAELRWTNNAVLAGGPNPSNDVYTVSGGSIGTKVSGLRLEVLPDSSLPQKSIGRQPDGNFVLTGFEVLKISGKSSEIVRIKSATADFNQKGYSITNLLNGGTGGWAVEAIEDSKRVPRSAYFGLAEPVQLRPGEKIQFRLSHGSPFPGANLGRFRIFHTADEKFEVVPFLPSEIKEWLQLDDSLLSKKQREKIDEYFRQQTPGLLPTREELASTQSKLKELENAIPLTSVMEELKQPRETHMHLRGSFLTKGDKVPPGVPGSLHSWPENAAYNRLSLARWLCDTNNPLTARVVVNRFWEQMFGIGLVETSEDFGTQGEPPSNQKLLDYLATEFMRQKWSMKSIHKTMVMSATYRQDSKVYPILLEKDPYNRLLARGPRTRLDAETIRDQALAVSGLLSRKIGGPSVMPRQPDGIWQIVYSDEKWVTSKDQDQYRRGLYTFWRRTSPYPSMVTFDAPSREFCVIRRNRSNTPLQALVLLNDPVYWEAASSLAMQVLTCGKSSVEERIRHAFQVCLAREPKLQEIARLKLLIDQEKARFNGNSEQAGKIAGQVAASFQGDPGELAAWTMAANVMLNLDEMVTKN